MEEQVDEDELAQLGKSMKTRFDEVMEVGFVEAVPKGWAKTSADTSKKALSRRKAKTAA